MDEASLTLNPLPGGVGFIVEVRKTADGRFRVTLTRRVEGAVMGTALSSVSLSETLWGAAKVIEQAAVKELPA